LTVIKSGGDQEQGAAPRPILGLASFSENRHTARRALICAIAGQFGRVDHGKGLHWIKCSRADCPRLMSVLVTDLSCPAPPEADVLSHAHPLGPYSRVPVDFPFAL